MKVLLLGLVIMVGFGTVTSAQAQNQPVPVAIGTKVVRGAVNVATGWTEVPKQNLAGREESWAAVAFLGLIDGLA